MNVKLIKGYMPELYIENKAMNKMEEYIRQSDLEIGWLGSAIKENGTYIIQDVYLFKQEVHSTTTEITTEGLNEFAMELLEQENGMELWNNMRVWGHSHVDMSTSPSAQDNQQMDVFLENNNDFFIRIIANKKGDYNINIYDYEIGIEYERVPYSVKYDNEVEEKVKTISNQINILKNRLEEIINPSKEMINEIEKEIKAKVTKKTYQNIQVYNSNNYGYGRYGNYYYNKPKQKAEKYDDKYQEEIVYDVAKIFDELSLEDIFNLMMNIEAGGTSAELLSEYYFPNSKSLELDEMIEEYCEANINQYYDWLETGEVL